MESAIPLHLRCPRTRPPLASGDYTPPVPAYCARMDTSVTQVVTAYVGVQYQTATGRTLAREQLSALRGAARVPFGPRHDDLAFTVDEAGFETMVWAAYWSDPAAFEQWELAVAGWWNSDERLQGPCGWFREVALPSVERFETLFSSPDRPEGAARLGASMSREIREHAYWGSMRDRLPASQTDPLRAAGSCQGPAPGRRVRLGGSENLALIRSGQDWSDTEGDERRLYLQQIEPRLREGMDHLRDRGGEVGCLANRYLVQVDDDFHPLERSYGLSWWRDLEQMERWSESHPTHLEIFAAFMRMAQELDFQLRLRLYHEVSVLRAEEQRYEYLNCHPATGLLRTLALA
jgi:aldoxime dehydratase